MPCYRTALAGPCLAALLIGSVIGLAIGPAIGSALAFEAVVTPGTLKPGDPFIIEVSAPEGGAAPVAVIRGGRSDGQALPLSPRGEGRYFSLGALDIEEPPGAIQVSVSAGGGSLDLQLTVIEGGFPIQRLTLPDRQVFLSPQDQERANREASEMEAIWTSLTEPLFDGPFIMPLVNPTSTEFGARRIINGKKQTIHRGLDIRGALGTTVRAANRGTVAYLKDTFYGGTTVIIDHGLGVHTVYMHLQSTSVILGQAVSKGDAIGAVGATGRATGPHLHYGVKIGPASANPTALTTLPL